MLFLSFQYYEESVICLLPNANLLLWIFFFQSSVIFQASWLFLQDPSNRCKEMFSGLEDFPTSLLSHWSISQWQHSFLLAVWVVFVCDSCTFSAHCAVISQCLDAIKQLTGGRMKSNMLDFPFRKLWTVPDMILTVVHCDTSHEMKWPVFKAKWSKNSTTFSFDYNHVQIL